MITALLLSLLLQASPPAKASLSGVVVQNSTGEPIAGATVTIMRTDAKLGAFIDMVAGDRPPADITISSDILSLLAQEVSSRPQGAGGPPQGGGAREALALASLPIADIHEIVIGANGSVGVIPKSAPPTITDSQGRFRFDNLEPGTYKLISNANGFARQNYGQRSGAGDTIPIVLSAGTSRNDFVIRLNAVSAIGGHIFDRAGQPLAGISVQLFRFTYDESGRRKTQPAGSALTDDRGEYRMFFISPGRYYLSAGNSSDSNNLPGAPPEVNLQAGAGYVSNNRLKENYAKRYYPATDDEAAATAIDVLPGSELSGIDLTLNVQRYYRVLGRVIDPQSSQPATVASVQLTPTTPNDFLVRPIRRRRFYRLQRRNRTLSTIRRMGASSSGRSRLARTA
jgi:5-hydroxyisourate hydrolase-like protein (transthyretin family)